ncbi:hypothetical protein L907_07850 [Agrobacterium sp. C13]|nr:hypothetical protein L902_22130 [Agrobacterium radiobacter DSM 30147]KDR89612.1 hypothetical protein K538_04475 [Agrobacterium tumefaciens GW4]KVK44195.1 hypothetical protein L903_07890 [Agrobacterium sp. JL28]KVK62123.1 hypothetical protein L907_07850 [Agrobacterium sp. C13]
MENTKLEVYAFAILRGRRFRSATRGTMTDEQEIIERHAAGTLPELFVERMRRHYDGDVGKAFEATLIKLHNKGAIDVLESARTISSSSINQHDFFVAMHVYCELIPALQAEVPAMLTAVKALVARAGDDLASGSPNGAFRKWAEQGDRAQTTLAAVDGQDPDDAPYIFLGLQALAEKAGEDALTRAIAYLQGTVPPARSAAAKVIGTIALVSKEMCDRAANALVAASSAADDNSLGHILTAICELARAHQNLEGSAVSLIQAAIPRVGDQAIHQLSLELMFHGEELAPDILAGLIAVMHKVEVSSRATIDHIDAAGGKLIRYGRLDEALALVSPLIAKHEELASLEVFDSFSYSLRTLPPDRLAKVIADWLLSLDHNLGHATLSLVANNHGDGPIILAADPITLKRTDADKIVLAHRAVGYLFIHPITAASLMLGLIPGVAEDRRQVLVELLFDPLLINYSGALADWLGERAKDENDPVQPIIKDLLTRLESYIEGLRKAGRIKELRPSERERLIEGHRQQESMRQVHKQAEQKSVFMSLVSRSVMLYGNRSISYFGGSDGKKQRNETKLHGFSHSIEAPHLDILEPFDLDYKLRVFRAMRGAEP